jgi:ABC-type multidrug transport system fused ATPase/permease subunit
VTPLGSVRKPLLMKDLLVRLWAHIAFKRRIHLAILFVLMCTVSFAEVVSIGAVLPFLGALTEPERVFAHPYAQPLIHFLHLKQPSQLLLPLTALFAATAVLSGGLRLALHWGQTRLSYAVGADFSSSIYRRTLYQPYIVHLNRNSSEVISAISTKADNIVHLTLLPILVVLSSGMTMATIFVALITLEPMVALVSIMAFGSIYGVTMWVTKSRLLIYSSVISKEQTAIFKTLQEALGGIRDVLIDGTQAVYCRIFQSADQRLRKAKSNVGMISGAPRYVVEAFGMVVISILAYALAVRPQGIGSAIPIMGALALGAQRMLPVLQQGYSSWSILRSGLGSLDDAVNLLDQPLPDQADAPPAEPMPFRARISLDWVSYRYGLELPWALQDLRLDIPKGSKVGFIGTTGGGKSTVLDIVMGLLVPTSGALKIDGQSIGETNVRAWQAHIAHVPQAIFLTDASIAENIAFGVASEQIDLERVKRAARQAQIAQTIEGWVDQYNTFVGERGVRLSGGQRQRIGIARALYKNADVLILDEATSALDGDTERAVMTALSDIDHEITVLMVAHRLSTLRDCTHVVELVNGKVQRVGSYAEVVGLKAAQS